MTGTVLFSNFKNVNGSHYKLEGILVNIENIFKQIKKKKEKNLHSTNLS